MIKEILNARGFFNGEFNEDFDDDILQAVLAFQTASNGACGSVDGAVGPNTWKNLISSSEIGTN